MLYFTNAVTIRQLLQEVVKEDMVKDKDAK
jgi:hypothetical protein